MLCGNPAGSMRGVPAGRAGYATGDVIIFSMSGFNEKKLIEKLNAKLVYDAVKFKCAYSGLTSPSAYE